MRRGFTGARGFRWTRLVWSVLAAFALLLGLAVPANAEDGAWDPTLPPVISAGAPGDPVAIANQSLQATANATPRIRHTQLAEQRHRLRRQHCRLRLLGTGPVQLRRRGRAATEVLR